MKLNKEQAEQALRSLEEKWKKPRRCPVCQNTEWSVTDATFEIREFSGGGIVIGGGGSIIPTIVVTCNNCGNTLLFNAISLGIVKRIEKETKPQEETKNE